MNDKTPPIVKAVRQLSSGTVASLSGLRSYEDIDLLRELVARKAERLCELGALDGDEPWQYAWNAFKTSIDIGGSNQ